MADYTYATSPRKTYDEWTETEKKRAQESSDRFAAKEKAAQDTYRTTMSGIYDQNIKAQEETAAADTKKAYASYNAEFDANAASAFARERALKEQMANFGLTQSGYNATNQTALAVSRNNADAATRTARQQAVDTIAEELRKYKADSANELAATLAESERASAERVAAYDQSLQDAVHGNVMDHLERDDSLSMTIDSHNLEIYQKMADAYEQGNAALADEYAKKLLQIDQNGNIVQMPFDTSGASEYTEQKNREEAASRVESDDSTSGGSHSALGFPTQYYDYIEDARLSIAALVQTSDLRVQEAMTERALSLLYLIEQQSANAKGDGYMDSATFANLLRYVGVTSAQYELYKKSAAYD